jgi:hypothetical protein
LSSVGRGCTVCASPNRNLIEAALAAGRTQADVAKAYGVHYGAIQRHAKNHARKSLVKVAGPELHSSPVQTGTELGEDHRPAIVQLAEKLRETQAIYDSAVEGNVNSTSALVALKQAAGLIEQIGRLRGEFVPPPPVVIDLTTTPEWVKLRSKILKALKDYPEARQKVADAL